MLLSSVPPAPPAEVALPTRSETVPPTRSPIATESVEANALTVASEPRRAADFADRQGAEGLGPPQQTGRELLRLKAIAASEQPAKGPTAARVRLQTRDDAPPRSLSIPLGQAPAPPPVEEVPPPEPFPFEDPPVEEPAIEAPPAGEATDEEAEGEDAAGEEITGEEAIDEDIPGEEVTEENIPGEEVTEEDIPGEEITEEEATEEDIPGEEAAEEPAIRVIEVIADRQIFDQEANIAIAEGNVIVRFTNGIMTADRLRVNIDDRIAVAEGNVSLRRGEQVLEGDRFEYYFTQDQGTIFAASGEVFQPTAGEDFSPNLSTDASVPSATVDRTVSDVVQAGGIGFSVGVGSDESDFGSGGTVNRIRFAADRVDFDADGWEAEGVRLTNDPFSPPELEFRANTAVFRAIGPERDEIVTTRPRIVLDQTTAIPTFRNRVVLDRRERDPGLFNIGFDEEEHGGLFIERSFEVIDGNDFSFNVTPQLNIQRGLFDTGLVDGAAFGFLTDLTWTAGPRTSLLARSDLPTLAFEDFDDELRAGVTLRQFVGPLESPHRVEVGYSYRDRVFNGSLGFQTVRQNLGIGVFSPVVPLGDTGINLSYQASVRRITADTDREDLLDPFPRDNDRTTLGRFQGAASLSWGYPLWRGEALPPTPEEGLRYTPAPVVPYVNAIVGSTAVLTGYTNGDSQNSIDGTVGLQGQFGHFSRTFFDYTGFDIRYTQTALDGESPFEFDRLEDRQRLSVGIVQQIAGPVRASIRTSLNLETGETISTDYALEYSRRTYNVQIRYNPEQQIGSLNLRVNGFNWSGSPAGLGGDSIRPVTGGVVR